jgi:hypothetical protein
VQQLAHSVLYIGKINLLTVVGHENSKAPSIIGFSHDVGVFAMTSVILGRRCGRSNNRFLSPHRQPDYPGAQPESEFAGLIQI